MSDDIEWQLMDLRASRDMWCVAACIGWLLFAAALGVIYGGAP